MKEAALHGLLLVVVLAALFPEPFFRGETLLPGGLLYEYPPWETYRTDDVRPVENEVLIESLLMFNVFYTTAKGALAQGEWPLWNPFEFLGMPLLANYQSAVFYPPRLLHALFDTYFATTLYILLKVWLCGMTAYLCARYFRLSRPAARFASVGYMLSGYVMTWSYWAVPDVAAWLPVLLMGAEKVLRGRYGVGMMAVMLSGTLLLLAGHPESALTGSLGVGGYFFLRLFFEKRAGNAIGKSIAAMTVAWGVVLLVTSVQTLPFLEYLGESHTFQNRGADGGAQHFVPLKAAIALWAPRFFGSNADGNFDLGVTENSNFVSLIYSGVAIWLVLPCLYFARRGPVMRGRTILCLAIPAVILGVLSFNIPLLRPVFSLPILRATWGCYFFAFPALALSLLGGFALDRWFSSSRNHRDMAGPLLMGGVMLLVMAVAFLLYRPHMEGEGMAGYTAVKVVSAGLVLAAGIGLLWGHCFISRPKLLAHGLVALLAIDLIVAAQGLHGSARRSALFPETSLTTYLLGLEQPARVNAASAGIPTGLLEAYGIEGQWAYDGILPARQFAFFGNLHDVLWDKAEPLLSTRYYLHDPRLDATFPLHDTERFKKISEADGISVFENTRAFPRAFFVGAAEVVSDERVLFEKMRSPAFDPLKTVLLESEPALGVWTDESPVDGEISITARSTTTLTMDLRAGRDCYLVLSEAYFPGWSVSIDGSEGEVIPAYHLLRAVPVRAGYHEVQLTYSPWSFRIGRGLATVTLIVAAAICLLELLVPAVYGTPKTNEEGS